MKFRHVSMAVLIATSVLLGSMAPVHAKRAAPKAVEAVVIGSVRYSAPREPEVMGFVIATDVASGKELWRQRIYNLVLNPSLEQDVQSVFITALIPRGDTLLISNERGDRFTLDLTTRKVAKDAPDLSKAPKAIRDLAESIQGKSSDEVRTVLIERLGPAQRNIGSGERIEQWDIAGGVLTFHPFTGPSFYIANTKTAFRLLQTHNQVAANILQGYEMTTLPDPANYGNRFWLGNLKFGRGSTYEFTDSGQHPKQRAAQVENFFLLYPRGTVEVRYVAPLTAEMLLESVAENTRVADLVFTAADHKHRATFSITSSERERRLVFGADKPLPFCMDTSWKNFWR